MATTPGALPPTRPRAPWHYRLAKWIGRHTPVPGSGVWIRTAHRLGLLNCVVRYPVAGELTIDVPLYRRATQWDAQQVLDYERGLLDTLAAQARILSDPIWLIDCGADIGLFSVGLLARLPRLARIVAFEPDSGALPVLARNLARLPVPAEARGQGVAACSGRGALLRPPGELSEHAQQAIVDRAGPLELVRLDQALASGRPQETGAGGPWGSLILKLDVEGGELDALRGAEQLLRNTRSWIVVCEAHPGVARRTGQDPILCARLLAQLGAQRLLLAELPAHELKLDRELFAQVPAEGVYNLLAIRRAD